MSEVFYELDIEERTEIVRKAYQAGVPLMTRWTDLTSAWAPRAEVAGQWLASSESIADIGCGTMVLETYLLDTNIYIPVDLVARDERTLVVDINKEDGLTRLPNAQACALLGVLEYCYIPEVVVSALCKKYGQIIVSFNPLSNVSEIQQRFANGWVNHYDAREIVDLFTRNDFVLKRNKVLDGKRNEQIFDFRRCL